MAEYKEDRNRAVRNVVMEDNDLPTLMGLGEEEEQEEATQAQVIFDERIASIRKKLNEKENEFLDMVLSMIVPPEMEEPVDAGML